MVVASDLWGWLAQVPDPEIPAISIVDLGIVRDVRQEADGWVVAVTPTYSGCPATAVIDMTILQHLESRGLAAVRIEHALSPPWTTAWISAEGRAKLRSYGIAPPGETACPRCGGKQTERVSQFGSTPCKASYRCLACLEPFDVFKCI